ncbi:MAG: hypothetical protein ACREBU_22075, partial [Nitrososphaera sp.]
IVTVDICSCSGSTTCWGDDAGMIASVVSAGAQRGNNGAKSRYIRNLGSSAEFVGQWRDGLFFKYDSN